MTETGAQPPAQLLQALDAVLSASSSSAEGTPPPDDEALHRQAFSTSREAEQAPREVRGKRHRGASAGGDPANDAPLGKKSRKRKRKRGKGASALLQDDVRKGLQHEIEYAQMGRRQRPGDDEPWTEADGPTVDAAAKEGPRKQGTRADCEVVAGAPRGGLQLRRIGHAMACREQSSSFVTCSTALACSSGVRRVPQAGRRQPRLWCTP